MLQDYHNSVVVQAAVPKGQSATSDAAFLAATVPLPADMAPDPSGDETVTDDLVAPEDGTTPAVVSSLSRA